MNIDGFTNRARDAVTESHALATQLNSA